MFGAVAAGDVCGRRGNTKGEVQPVWSDKTDPTPAMLDSIDVMTVDIRM